jgi:hypothetical protein
VAFKILYRQAALADLEGILDWSLEKHPGRAQRDLPQTVGQSKFDIFGIALASNPSVDFYWFMTKAKSLSPAPTTRYWRPSSS